MQKKLYSLFIRSFSRFKGKQSKKVFKVFLASSTVKVSLREKTTKKRPKLGILKV